MRVLLVEDDRMIGEVLESALRDAAYAVDWVRDGHLALTALAGQQYELVLLDLGLPKKDGFEVLRAIRAASNPVPGSNSTPFSAAIRRATCFKPKSRICSAVGPMNTIPCARQASANSAFSLRNP